MDRHSRQILFPPIGAAGQERLLSSRVAVVGLGAVGAACAALLARAGVGRLWLVDRDVVEESNLHRQLLYTEADAAGVVPKAVAAARALAAAGTASELTPMILDVTAASSASLATVLADGPVILLDATDTYASRYLLSDLAVRGRAPLCYAGAVGSRAAAALLVPPHTPCLRCLFPEPPPLPAQETCDTSGVIGPAAQAAASHAVAMVMRHVVERAERIVGWLWSGDVWDHASRCRELTVGDREPACVACSGDRFPSLQDAGAPVVRLCGRDTYQVNPPPAARPDADLGPLAERLRRVGVVSGGTHAVRVDLRAGEASVRLTVFADGRVLVAGVDSPERARRLCAEVVGA